MKCDEHKPICTRCLKSSRECIYPPFAHKDKTSSGQVREGVKEIENRRPGNDSGSLLNLDLLDVDDGTQKAIMKFSPQGSSTATSPLDFFQFGEQILIDSSSAHVNITGSSNISPNSMLYSSLSAIRPSYFYEGVVPSTRAIQLPQIPKSIRDRFVQFFIDFHQGNVNEFHYFCYYDYRRFCTRTLMVMIEQSSALRDAVVAFSALIYSVKIDRSARVLAFLYYASALQQLRVLLDQVTLNIDECHLALATILHLASFDVFTISIKCADS